MTESPQSPSAGAQAQREAAPPEEAGASTNDLLDFLKRAIRERGAEIERHLRTALSLVLPRFRP
jgi:hypothetical protein